MHVWEHIAIVVTAPGLLLTALTLRQALADRRALRAAGTNGLLSCVVCQHVRHEGLRLLQHLILFFALAVAAVAAGREGEAAYGWATNARNGAIAIVSLLLTLNSLMDLVTRRRVAEELERLQD